MDHTRSWDILTPHLIQRLSVGMIGLGGIGAATAVTLAKMGVGYFYLYDHDKVEPLNIPTQLLKISDVGKSKTHSVMHLMQDLSDTHGEWQVVEVKNDTPLRGAIIISSVDSIEARQEIWPAVMNSVCDWYLDARMGAEVFQLHTVRMNTDCSWYEDPLMALSEDDIPDEPCTAKATFYCAMMAAGLIGHQVKRIAMNQVVPKMIALDIPSLQLVVPSGELSA